MNHFIFIVIFVVLAYLNVIYFLRVIRDKEKHREIGFFNPLYFSRFLFFCGLPILIFFIYDIFRIHLAISPDFIWQGGLTVMLTLLAIITIDKACRLRK